MKELPTKPLSKRNQEFFFYLRAALGCYKGENWSQELSHQFFFLFLLVLKPEQSRRNKKRNIQRRNYREKKINTRRQLRARVRPTVTKVHRIFFYFFQIFFRVFFCTNPPFYCRGVKGLAGWSDLAPPIFIALYELKRTTFSTYLIPSIQNFWDFSWDFLLFLHCRGFLRRARFKVRSTFPSKSSFSWNVPDSFEIGETNWIFSFQFWRTNGRPSFSTTRWFRTLQVHQVVFLRMLFQAE